MRFRLLALVCAGLIVQGCDAPERNPDEREKPVETPGSSPAAATEEPSLPPGSAPAAESEVNLDPQDELNRQVKREVLARVDLVPGLDPRDKDRLYVQVERARAMGKVVTVPFDSGKTRLSQQQIAGVKKEMQEPQVAALVEDPTVVFVVLGFADLKGSPGANQKVSDERAQTVAEVLKEDCGLFNVIHPVGMGGSDFFDAEGLDRNRVAEIWAVRP